MTDEPSEKRNKFLNLAEKRTEVILDKLRVLGNCSNRQAYEYTDEDLDKIFTAIEKQLAATKARFEKPKPIRFRLR